MDMVAFEPKIVVSVKFIVRLCICVTGALVNHMENRKEVRLCKFVL